MDDLIKEIFFHRSYVHERNMLRRTSPRQDSTITPLPRLTNHISHYSLHNRTTSKALFTFARLDSFFPTTEKLYRIRCRSLESPRSTALSSSAPVAFTSLAIFPRSLDASGIQASPYPPYPRSPDTGAFLPRECARVSPRFREGAALSTGVDR